MTFAYTTATLPAAQIGVPYEAAVTGKGSVGALTAQAVVQTGALNGLPTGLSLDASGGNPGSLRITGTPTGAASAGNTPLSGEGNYTFQLTVTDGATPVASSTLTIPLVAAVEELSASFSVAAQATRRNLK